MFVLILCTQELVATLGKLLPQTSRAEVEKVYKWACAQGASGMFVRGVIITKGSHTHEANIYITMHAATVTNNDDYLYAKKENNKKTRPRKITFIF